MTTVLEISAKGVWRDFVCPSCENFTHMFTRFTPVPSVQQDGNTLR